MEIKSVAGQQNIEFLKDHVHDVEEVYFAGGEPLLMPEHWEILELLKRCDRTDVKLSYNTNFGNLEYRGRKVLDYWRAWQGELYIQPSIDEVGERASLVRSGTNWTSLEANLKSALDAGIDLNPNITVSVLNVHRVPAIIDYLIGIGVIRIHPDRSLSCYLNVVQSPAHYHVSVLPAERRELLIQRIHGYVQFCSDRHGARVAPLFTALLGALRLSSTLADRTRFRTLTKQLDEVRSENTAAMLPELAELLERDD